MRRLGFTLIEFVVVITIIGIIMAVVSGGWRRWSGSELRSAANRLSVTIQYLKGRASSEGLYARLKFNLDSEYASQSYSAEFRKEPFLLTTAEQKEKLKEIAKIKIKDIVIGKETAVAGDESAEGADGAKDEEETTPLVRYDPSAIEKDSFADTAGDRLTAKVIDLPKGVFIKDIWTGHSDGPVSSGEEYIYFFPNGAVEAAVINLMNAHDTINYSIEINPLLGTTKVEKKYKELKNVKESL